MRNKKTPELPRLQSLSPAFSGESHNDGVLAVTASSNDKKPINWKKWIPIAFCGLFTIIGLLLLATGIGSAAGVALCVNAAAILFGWSPLGAVMTAILLGEAAAIISVIKGVDCIKELASENKPVEIASSPHQPDSSYTRDMRSLLSQPQSGSEPTLQHKHPHQYQATAPMLRLARHSIRLKKVLMAVTQMPRLP